MLADTRKQFARDAESWWIHATNFINATARLFLSLAKYRVFGCCSLLLQGR
jgi:hypothetical protein